MSDSQAPGFTGRDVLGLALMVLAVFSGVSVFMALGDRPVEAHGTTTVFLAMVDTLGPIASFVLSLGLALVGLALFLKGVSSRILRHLAGVLIMTFSVSILVGTLDAQWGGWIGTHLGQVVTRQTNMILGVAYGAMWVLLPAWFFWLRPAERAAQREESVSLAPRGGQVPDSEGVSAAEAEALLPQAAPALRRVPPSAAPKVTPLDPRPANQPTSARNAPSPYPADVRVRGGIPEGARPLESSHARQESQSAHHDEPVQREPARPTAGGQHGRAVAPVAAVELPATGQHAADEQRLAPRREAPSHAVRESAPAAPASGLATPLAPQTESLPAPDSSANPFSRTPPAPSWEQPELFEEPVDAYGTPLSLVEELRKGAEPVADPEASVPAARAELVFDERDLDDEADLASVKPLVAGAHAAPHAEVEGAEDDAADDDDADDADDDARPAAGQLDARRVLAPSLFGEDDAAPQPAVDEAELDSDDELEDDEPAEGDGAGAELPFEAPVTRVSVALGIEPAAALTDAADVDEDDAEANEDADADDDGADAVDDDARAEDDDDADADDADADEDEQAQGDAEAGARARAAVRLEVDESDERAAEQDEVVVAAAAEPDAVDAPAAAVALREVVLHPPAASGVKSKPQFTVTETSYKAGCLFLERQRVAVSMLQREFSMDFKTATAVLDELQKVGLIGPYLGGQRRDILMTPAEWQERVEVA